MFDTRFEVYAVYIFIGKARKVQQLKESNKKKKPKKEKKKKTRGEMQPGIERKRCKRKILRKIAKKLYFFLLNFQQRRGARK